MHTRRVFHALLVMGWLCACSDDGPSDEDLLERFVEEVTGEVDEALLDRAERYTDFAQVPVDVRAPGHAGVYRQEREAEIKSAFRQAMRRFFWGSKLRLRASTIEIDGEHADVGLRLLTDVGPLRVDTSLEKTTAGWKVSKVHVQRGL